MSHSVWNAGGQLGRSSSKQQQALRIYLQCRATATRLYSILKAWKEEEEEENLMVVCCCCCFFSCPLYDSLVYIEYIDIVYTTVCFSFHRAGLDGLGLGSMSFNREWVKYNQREYNNQQDQKRTRETI
jgi:hypothetical protein